MFNKKTPTEKLMEEVEKKKKSAISNGYDGLFSYVANELLVHYKAWSTNGNEKWVHHKVKNITDSSKSRLEDISFDFEDRHYRVVRERNYHIPTDNILENYFDLTLFLNNEKVFGIFEKETQRYATYYSTIDITSYKNDLWVNDFQQIYDLYHKLSGDVSTELKQQQLENYQKDFGLSLDEAEKEQDNE